MTLLTAPGRRMFLTRLHWIWWRWAGNGDVSTASPIIKTRLHVKGRLSKPLQSGRDTRGHRAMKRPQVRLACRTRRRVLGNDEACGRYGKRRGQQYKK